MELSVHAETQLPSTKIKGALFHHYSKSLSSRQARSPIQTETPLLLAVREGFSTTWKQSKVISLKSHSNPNILSFIFTHPFVQQSSAGCTGYKNLKKNQTPGQTFLLQRPSEQTRKGHDLILTQKTRQWESECLSKTLPFTQNQTAEKGGHFNACRK